MRKIYSFLALFLFVFIAKAQIITIPDPNFKAKLIANGVDSNSDGEIQESEALSVTGLYLDSANISSLEGIQNFSNATTLWCSYNNLTEINLCETAIGVLFCYNNPNLTSINLKNNVISQTIWQEPPFPPFWVENLPSLQYICGDAAEMAEAQIYFNEATTNTITYSSGCDNSNCSSALNLSQQQNYAVTVYPNPTKSKLNITLAKNTTIKSIHIYNVIGQLVHTNTYSSETIDVSELKNGTYFIKIISDNGIATSKFIKE